MSTSLCGRKGKGGGNGGGGGSASWAAKGCRPHCVHPPHTQALRRPTSGKQGEHCTKVCWGAVYVARRGMASSSRRTNEKEGG